MAGREIFFGFVALLMFGFLAAIMTPIFDDVIGNYDPTVQLIIMGIIPVVAIALLFRFFIEGGGTEQTRM